MLIREVTYGLSAIAAMCFIIWDVHTNHGHLATDRAELAKQVAIIKAEEIAAVSRVVPYDSYLKVIWIEAIKDSDKQIIYVPTEDDTPVMPTKGLWELIKGVMK